MVLFECGNYTLNNGFDSGNLGRVELVKKHADEIFSPSIDPLNTDSSPNSVTVNVEINVWTRPDCAGTPFENGNRTWFYFSVKGGQPSHILRLNVMNLNRQAKLYSQGMHPVVKIGQSGKWERAKDRPSYRIDEENFVMSFVHRCGEDTSVEHFYAFTFPYTYRELQEYLARLDRRFRKRMFEIQKKSLEENISLFVEQADLDGLTTATATTTAGTISPTNSSLSLLLRRDSSDSTSAELTSADDLYNEIYYCRELLTHSVEQRRIDLLTITSYHGISAEREERLDGLFPELLRHRCHSFRNKKIVFLSSRVHPGETPASFVLNGFIRLLLDRKSQIAATLRRMYVFKIVPFLNPDGVCNGLYRSDTLGHNLNRVYTSPDPKKHPSIYAVRRLLRFYQFGCETSPTELPEPEVAKEHPVDLPNSEFDAKVEPEERPETHNQVVSLKDLIINQLNREHSKEETLVREKIENQLPQIEVTVDTCDRGKDESYTPLGSLDGTESSDSKSVASVPTARGRKVAGKAKANAKASDRSTPSTIASAARHKTGGGKKEFKRKASPKATVMSASYKAQDLLKDKAMESMIGHLSATGIDFHNLYNQFESESQEKGEDKTNLFLYVDLHGHASKKGVFMYGNHMAHPMQAVECLLLPRLMSMNSHHFHFDACNFSERNMYHQGKRDGLSKEGSGRVAIYKSTGLIKCYTLECNYNTGKYVNVLPARGKDKAPRAVNLVPPKYTPAIFEEVGRALGASILDLTNSNPISRLPNSEFRTLQGLRNALRLNIEKTFTKNQLLLKAAKGKLKRLKNALGFAKEGGTSSSQEVLKENRSQWPTGTANRTNSFSTVANLAASVPTARVSAIQGPIKYVPSSSGSSGGGTLYGKKERATRKKGKSESFAKKESPVPLLNLVPVKRHNADDLSATPSTSSSDEGRTTSSTTGKGATIPSKVMVKRTSGIPVFKRPTPLATISYAVPSTSKAAVGAPIAPKISTVSQRGAAIGSKIVGVSEAASIGSTGLKIKTKRPLKPDSLTVKRKKSRAKSVWH